ncbi:MAG: glycosyltransferase [Gammaproteobacteria bacterium]|nr:glycosyltransferase [Gammaproteobacteria bacterium]
MQHKKLNIAHFIGSLHIGGAENQVALLVNSLAEKGHKCHVIVMHEAEGYKGVLNDDVGYFNIDFRTRYAPAALLRLYKYLKENKIDVLHCHMYHAVNKGAVIGRLAKVPVIVTSEHGKNSWKNFYHHFIEKYIVDKNVDKRIAVSDDIRKIRIEDDGVNPDKIIVMPNSVNTDVPVADNSKQPVVLGTLGRLVDAKDFENLIRAINVLITAGRVIKLIIAGEGEERQKLESLIIELELSDVIEMPGIQPAASFLSSIDIFVMSSKREGVPVSLLEAMAYGLPIATTSVGGIPEVIQNEREGLLCESNNPQVLADIIARLLDDADLRQRLGGSANDKVIKYYSKGRVVDMWLDLYSSLYEKKRMRC